ADGTFEQWDFWLGNDDPLATISLTAPNEVFSIVRTAGGGWGSGADPSFLWESTSGPGWLSVRVRGPKSWNNCSDPGAVGICAVENYIWGNGSFLTVSSTQPGELHFRSTVLAVPEPATWAMMLLGFGAVGFSMRRKREGLLQQIA
ncbi:MAG: PEPxxWA-CTERM sorting domain-containing protein, partial [Sphingomicrobium sp.]